MYQFNKPICTRQVLIVQLIFFLLVLIPVFHFDLMPEKNNFQPLVFPVWTIERQVTSPSNLKLVNVLFDIYCNIVPFSFML